MAMGGGSPSRGAARDPQEGRTSEGASSRRSQIDRRFGSVLRARRQELGLTQVELADLCGMRAKEIQQIETGARSPTLLSLYVLARGLKISSAASRFPAREDH